MSVFSISLYHQTNSAFGGDEGVGVRHYGGIDLFCRDRGPVPADVEFTLVDQARNLLRPHSVTGCGQQVHDGFFDGHSCFRLRLYSFLENYPNLLMALGGLTSKGGKLKALIFNDKNYITMKKKMIYDAPDAELVVIEFENRLLNGSTQAEKVTYIDSDWD